MWFPCVLSLFLAAPVSAAPSVSILNNPLAMTIAQSLVFPKENKAVHGSVLLLPERKNVFLLEKDAELKFTYRLQVQKTAPMIFLIPGTGGNARSPGVLALAEKFYELGYTTITADNGFSWQFTLAGSSNGLPGYTPQDASDLYRALQAITNRIKNAKDLTPHSYSLVGYSLGASQSLFMQKIDERIKTFNFSKVLLINPPVDLLYAMNQLDHLFDSGDRLSGGRKIKLFNQVLDVGSRFLDSSTQVDSSNIQLLQGVFNQLQFSDRDLSYLIGGSFRDSLRDVIFASQQVHDLKILKSPVSRYRRNQRYAESRTFSFKGYMSRFVFPMIKSKKNKAFMIEDLNHEVSLYQFEDQIKSRKNIFLIHSQDDFILKAGDIAWLKESFGDRALIFPYGGHCGSMSFPQFKDHLAELFLLPLH